MMPEAGGFTFSTESPTLLNSKDKKRWVWRGGKWKKREQVILWRSWAMGSQALDEGFFVKGERN